MHFDLTTSKKKKKKKLLVEYGNYSMVTIPRLLEVTCLLEDGAYMRTGTYWRKYGIYSILLIFIIFEKMIFMIIEKILSNSRMIQNKTK